MLIIERFNIRSGEEVVVSLTEVSGRWVLFACTSLDMKKVNGVEFSMDIDMSSFKNISEFAESNIASKLALSLMRLAESETES